MDSYSVFILASLLLAITPGTDNLFVLTQSALYGKKAGLLITFVVCTGLIFHNSLGAFGFAIIFQSSWALVALKSFGACYLFYLAFKSLTATNATFKAPVPLSNIALYRRGIIMNSTNPKVSLFFLAFLPQFIFIESGSYIIQVFILGGLFAVTGFCVFTCIAYAGDSLQQRLNKTPNVQISLNRIAGIVYIALAINVIR